MALVNREASLDALAGQVIHLRWDVELEVCHHPRQSPALVFLDGEWAIDLMGEYNMIFSRLKVEKS